MQISEANIRDFFYNARTTYGFIEASKELSVGGLRLDIFAIDENHNPYIIEFKKSKSKHIVGQSAHYLTMLPVYKKDISRKIKFHKINWDSLSAILIAPEYYEHDEAAAKSPILRDRIHLYVCKPTFTTRDKVFGLRLEYAGPAEIGPLKLPQSVANSSDLVDLHQYFENLDTRESKREYYTDYVLPILHEIDSKTGKFFNSNGLYFHTSYFGNDPPYYLLRYRTHEKQKHRASIALSFHQSGIDYGFDLTHSFEEAQLLSKYLQNEKSAKYFVKKLQEKIEYQLYVPNTGLINSIDVNSLTPDLLKVILQRYSPRLHRDCYFRITKNHEESSLSIDDATKILKEQFVEFKFLFDLFKNA